MGSANISVECFHSWHQIGSVLELKYLRERAWATFHKHKKVLLNQQISLRHRLKFFDVTISPAILYALAAFPVTESKCDELDRIQRKMLHRIVGWRRTEGEDWEETMRRMRDRLQRAEQLYHCQEWSKRLICDKWRLAEHISLLDPRKWARLLTTYQANHVDDEYAPLSRRGPGRPLTRWEDKMQFFCRLIFSDGQHWTKLMEGKGWYEYEDACIACCIE